MHGAALVIRVGSTMLMMTMPLVAAIDVAVGGEIVRHRALTRQGMLNVHGCHRQYAGELGDQKHPQQPRTHKLQFA